MKATAALSQPGISPAFQGLAKPTNPGAASIGNVHSLTVLSVRVVDEWDPENVITFDDAAEHVGTWSAAARGW